MAFATVSIVTGSAFPSASAQAKPATIASAIACNRGRSGEASGIVAADVMRAPPNASSARGVVRRRPLRRRPAVGDAEPVPDIDRGYRRRQIHQLPLGEFAACLGVDLITDAVGQMCQRLGPRQRGALARREDW